MSLLILNIFGFRAKCIYNYLSKNIFVEIIHMRLALSRRSVTQPNSPKGVYVLRLHIQDNLASKRLSSSYVHIVTTYCFCSH